MTVFYNYSLEEELKKFFENVSVSQSECDNKARALVGGDIVPVTVQGSCSYTVFAGPSLEYVVQFRLKSLILPQHIHDLARKVHGRWAPEVTLHGELGQGADGESLLVYVMTRIKGVSALDFILACSLPTESAEYHNLRLNLISDLGRFFAESWKAPQSVPSDHTSRLQKRYTSELRLLLESQPARLHPSIKGCLESMDSIMALPMVLLHRDFGDSNVIVDAETFHLTGVIDWAEAEICPFGQNLYRLELFTGMIHYKEGYRPVPDHDKLLREFWTVFRSETGVANETIQAIKLARTMGLLLSYGFTSRFANQPPTTPIIDDDRGRYNMLYLDGFLTNPATRFEDL